MKKAEQFSDKAVVKYKIHWHVLYTHFPVSFFMISFLFMIIHFVTRNHCYENAASLGLLAGLIILVPTLISGWLTWKNKYKGLKGSLFLHKIRIAYGMIAVSFVLIVLRILLHEEHHIVWMWVYPAGISLLLLGSMIEGYYGGRLNHR